MERTGQAGYLQVVPARWRVYLHWASALLLISIAGLFLAAQIRLIFAPATCVSEGGLQLCPAPIAPWLLLGSLPIGIVLAALSLMRRRPELLLGGWLVICAGFELWWVLQIMFLDGGLWGKETTFARAVWLVVGRSETLILTAIVAVTALILLPARRQPSP